LEEVGDELPIVPPVQGRQTDGSQVLSALSRVDEVYQAAVALFYLDEFSYNEIAHILEVPLGTIKSRIARGVAQLKEIVLSGERCDSAERDLSSTPHPIAPVEPAASSGKRLAPRACHTDLSSIVHERPHHVWSLSPVPFRELLGDL
jgi:RNA polymerase sigma-70 factor (ECF subfamily)